jgi:MFS transporter, PAT family, beta-lactamase induction signal transducer AmpG
LESIAGVRPLPPFAYCILSLPSGLAQGYVSVALSYHLAHHGVPVSAIAGMEAAFLLPSTWRFLVGPVLDMSLSPVKWFMIGLGAAIGGILALTLAPHTLAAMPLLSLVALITGIGANVKATAAGAAMAASSPINERGQVAGWQNAGLLGGVGLGGGLALWITTHAGGLEAAGFLTAVLAAACAAPMLWIRLPPLVHEAGVLSKAVEIRRALTALVRSRSGVLVALACVIPAGIDAASNLFPAVSRDWGASADLVALVTGGLGGLITVPGCIVGGFLCDRFPRRTLFISSAIACAAGEAAMAVMPHTPPMFAVMVLANAFLLGIAYACISAVIYEVVGRVGAATVMTVMVSLTNVPVVGMTLVVGAVQTRAGSSAMLLAEAGLAMAAIGGYAALAWWWKPASASAATAYAEGMAA